MVINDDGNYVPYMPSTPASEVDLTFAPGLAAVPERTRTSEFTSAMGCP
jgi:hypothetical protein